MKGIVIGIGLLWLTAWIALGTVGVGGLVTARYYRASHPLFYGPTTDPRR